MTPELTALALAALWQGAHWAALSVAANRQLGVRVTMGSRDSTPEMPPRLGRLYRAFHNHYEALILFSIAALLTTLSDQGSAFTAACAWVYLAARIAYVPAYILALMPWRSVIWVVGFAATMLMIVAALV